jgi:hypothetical protein
MIQYGVGREPVEGVNIASRAVHAVNLSQLGDGFPAPLWGQSTLPLIIRKNGAAGY